MEVDQLTDIQKNILFASIIADGEITKLYPNSRRKNNSYREHYGKEQESYRVWKASFFDCLLYFRPKGTFLVSKSDPLFTSLYHIFYNQQGQKRIPIELLEQCNLPYFLSILYLDDGSLSITKRANHLKKTIYLAPHIYLYLQNFPLNELQILKQHILNTFGFNFSLPKRRDGFGHVLKLTKVNDSLDFLKLVLTTVNDLKGMEYKCNWEKRLIIESEKLLSDYPNYKVLTSDSERFRNYTEDEIEKIISSKISGFKVLEIAKELNRSYDSIVYKMCELRKNGRLK